MPELKPNPSVRDLQRTFREAPEPELDALAGTHEAKFAGWLRVGGPLAMGVAAIVINYPPDARWPHRRVRDELRPLDERTLLGLSFGLLRAPHGGAPFILHRQDEAQ